MKLHYNGFPQSVFGEKYAHRQFRFPRCRRIRDGLSDVFRARRTRSVPRPDRRGQLIEPLNNRAASNERLFYAICFCPHLFNRVIQII